MLRIFLFGAFVISLGFATTWKDDVTGMGMVARWLPVSLLALALIAGLAERVYRTKNGIPPIRFGRG